MKNVARQFRLDPEELEQFARQNKDKFHLIEEDSFSLGNKMMVSTFNTDDLVREFKQAQENFEKARVALETMK